MEGHDARLLRFSASKDNSIKGGHAKVKNNDYWMVGCLGIRAPCKGVCQTSFLDCVEKSAGKKAIKRTQGWARCMDPKSFAKLEGCTAECAPTFDMLVASEN